MPTSSGTRRPASRSASATPRAIWSLPQKTPSNSCLVLYLLLQRFYVTGLVAGALRG
jgi:hypothetical protein